MLKDDQAAPETPPDGRKKPYEKPAFRYENVFETRALSCGKMQATGGACAINRRTS